MGLITGDTRSLDCSSSVDREIVFGVGIFLDTRRSRDPGAGHQLQADGVKVAVILLMDEI